MNQTKNLATTHYHQTCLDLSLTLHKHLKAQDYTKAIALIQANSDEILAQEFVFNQGSYTRNILDNSENYWLMVVHWDKNAQSPIHGHPAQAFIYLLEGELLIDNYQPPDFTPSSSVVCYPAEYHIHHGKEGVMDNAVHRVTATKTSISLHFYSGDPSKCDVF